MKKAREIWWTDWNGTEHHVTRLSWESKAAGGEWKSHVVTPELLPLFDRIIERGLSGDQA